MRDTRVRDLLPSRLDQLSLVVKIDRFAGMGEEDCVPILSLRLEQLDRIILLSCAIRAVFIVGPVMGVDLAPKHGAFKPAAGFAHLFGSQLPRN